MKLAVECTKSQEYAQQTQYRQPKGASLFETENTNIALSSMGNPLVQLNGLIDFEMFRETLENLIFTKEHKAMSGRCFVCVDEF